MYFKLKLPDTFGYLECTIYPYYTVCNKAVVLDYTNIAYTSELLG